MLKNSNCKTPRCFRSRSLTLFGAFLLARSRARMCVRADSGRGASMLVVCVCVCVRKCVRVCMSVLKLFLFVASYDSNCICLHEHGNTKSYLWCLYLHPYICMLWIHIQTKKQTNKQLMHVLVCISMRIYTYHIHITDVSALSRFPTSIFFWDDPFSVSCIH